MEVKDSDLRKHSFFGGLMDDQIETILPLMKIETIEEGNYITREGQPNDKIYFILEGKAEAEKNGVRLFEFEEGTTFGEMEVLDIMATEASIKALAPTKLMYLSNSALHTLSKMDLKVFSILIMNLARDLSRRLRNMNQKFSQATGS